MLKATPQPIAHVVYKTVQFFGQPVWVYMIEIIHLRRIVSGFLYKKHNQTRHYNPGVNESAFAAIRILKIFKLIMKKTLRPGISAEIINRGHA